jgi:hypothetical protein
MSDFRLKLALSILSAVLFSFVFILLAFAVPLDKKETVIIKKPANKLEKISEAMREKE